MYIEKVMDVSYYTENQYQKNHVVNYIPHTIIYTLSGREYDLYNVCYEDDLNEGTYFIAFTTPMFVIPVYANISKHNHYSKLMKRRWKGLMLPYTIIVIAFYIYLVSVKKKTWYTEVYAFYFVGMYCYILFNYA